MESYTLVLHRLGTPAAHRWLGEVGRGSGRIKPQAADIAAAARGVRQYPDPAITLFDAVLAEFSERLESPVWTFDRHFDVLRVQVWR